MFDLEGVNYIDISPEINSSIAVYPGDVEFKRDVSFDTHQGNHMTLSSIESTLHLGAHTDAPIHYSKSDEGIDKRSLDYYIGPCQVIDVSQKVGPGGMIVADDIYNFQIETSRILFKTDSFNHHSWSDNFVYFSPLLIKALVDKGVKLVGIDTPSVDKSDSKTLDAHQAIYNNNMSILEGIDLRDVKEGKYQLIALPLKIKDGDASPVRAILIPHE